MSRAWLGDRSDPRIGWENVLHADLGTPEDVVVLAHVGIIQTNVRSDNVCGGGYDLQWEAETFVANSSIATD